MSKGFRSGSGLTSSHNIYANAKASGCLWTSATLRRHFAKLLSDLLPRCKYALTHACIRLHDVNICPRPQGTEETRTWCLCESNVTGEGKWKVNVSVGFQSIEGPSDVAQRKTSDSWLYPLWIQVFPWTCRALQKDLVNVPTFQQTSSAFVFLSSGPFADRHHSQRLDSVSDAQTHWIGSFQALTFSLKVEHSPLTSGHFVFTNVCLDIRAQNDEWQITLFLHLLEAGVAMLPRSKVWSVSRNLHSFQRPVVASSSLLNHIYHSNRKSKPKFWGIAVLECPHPLVAWSKTMFSFWRTVPVE